MLICLKCFVFVIRIFFYGDAALRQAMIQIGMVDKDATQANFETYDGKWDPYKLLLVTLVGDD